MKDPNIPTIGLTCSDLERSVPYTAMLEKFGAVVKLITPSSFTSLSEIMDTIDGLMLSGGADVHLDVIVKILIRTQILGTTRV